MSVISSDLRFAPSFLIKMGLRAVLIVCAALPFSCDRSDVISGVGESVIADSLRTNTGAGFVRFDLEFDRFTGKSIPDSADPAFSTHIQPSCIVNGRGTACTAFGLTDDNDTLAAHFRFVMRPFSSFAGVTPPYERSTLDSLNGAFLFFRAHDEEASASDVPVYFHAALDSTKHVSRDDIITNIEFTFGDDSLQTSTPSTTSLAPGQVGAFSLSGNALDSIPLPIEIAQRLFDTRVFGGDSSFRDTLAFSIMDYAGDLVRFATPYIILSVTRYDIYDNDTAVIRDSLVVSFTRFTAYEDNELAKERAKLPYSSFYTKRTAVLYVDTDTLFINGRPDASPNTMPCAPHCELNPDYELGELVNAALMINNVPSGSAGEDEDGSVSITTSDNANLFSAIGWDSLLVHEFPANADSVSRTLALRNRFSGSVSLRAPFNAMSVKNTLHGIIREGKSGMYVYLRSATENSTILWNTGHPLRIETNFTRARDE